LAGRKKLVVLAGPTAVGKTDLSIFLATELDCEIISADSRQFYKEMKIGTAKPDAQQLRRVKHHFIDIFGVEQHFSAGRFEVAVLALLDRIYDHSDCVLMVGGSGLYIQSVCEGMHDIPEVNPGIRQRLYEEYHQSGLAPLVKELEISDPDYAGVVDTKNQQRVIRALEVFRATGQPYSSFRKDRPLERSFETIKIGLERERKELFERIDQRMDSMIGSGLFEEASALFAKRGNNALRTVGYQEVFGYLEGKYNRHEAIRLLRRNSRRYAKRQMTWFKRDQAYTWFHPDQKEDILAFIRKRL
jgi:tRNA dimethylallyltransferase